MASRKDQFANRAFVEITMSAANTITFQQVRFAVGTFQGIGLLLHRVEYYLLTATIQEMIATTDLMEFGITLRDDLTALSPTSQSVVSLITLNRDAARTAEGELVKMPIAHDFRDFPGGGLLLPANPIFLAMDTGGAAAASQFRCIMYYTLMELSDRESIELLQTIIPGNV